MAAVSAPAARPIAPKPRPKPIAPAPAADPTALAQKKLDAELARQLPEVPADKAGKEQWVKDGKARVSGMKKSLEILRDAWFDGKLSFDAYTAMSRKVFDFETKISRVEHSLKPPAPPAPGKPGTEQCPPYLTPDLVNAMNKHPDSPLNVFGAIALPFTLLLDGMNGLSRLSNACKKPAEAKAQESKATEAKGPEAKTQEAKAQEAKGPEAKAPEAQAPEAKK